MSEELLYDYDDDMLQIDLDYFNQFDNLFNDSSGTDSFRFAHPPLTIYFLLECFHFGGEWKTSFGICWCDY